MDYILFYDVVDDYVEKRAEFRKAHMKLAKEAHARGELILAGALVDPEDGAVFSGVRRRMLRWRSPRPTLT